MLHGYFKRRILAYSSPVMLISRKLTKDKKVVTDFLLCNPNFVDKLIISISAQDLLCSNKDSIYFLYPLAS